MVLRGVSLVGKGLGTVVQPVSIRVNTKYPTTRISHYVTDPPVLEDGPLCITSSLAPVAGYVLPPGGPPVTLYVVMRSLRPGHFTIEGHSIVYQQGRWTYRQLQPLGVYGSVSAAASPLRPTPEEQACANGNVRIFPQPTAAATT